VSDGELPAGLLRVLDPDRPRGTLLAERLRQRFGRARFEAQLRRLLESASARQA
jgi:hypothetical protein